MRAESEVRHQVYEIVQKLQEGEERYQLQSPACKMQMRYPFSLLSSDAFFDCQYASAPVWITTKPLQLSQ
jgi:hypothetical protein